MKLKKKKKVVRWNLEGEKRPFLQQETGIGERLYMNSEHTITGYLIDCAEHKLYVWCT